MKILSWISSIRHLAILYVGVLFVSSGVVGTFLYIAYHNNANTETRAALKADARGFIDIYSISKTADSLRNAVNQRLKNRDVSSFYLLNDSNGKRIAGNLYSLPKEIDDRDGDFITYEIPYGKVIGNAPQEHNIFHPFYDVMTLSVALDDGSTLYVGRDIDAFENSRKAIIWLAWIAVGLACTLALIGFMMGALILKHIQIINKTANTIIETGDLSSRIPDEYSAGDLKKLSTTFNNMLNHIQDLVEGIRQVSDNIAHDLRTPLTRLKYYIEALKNEEAEVTIDNISNETDRIISTFNALLGIANIEHGKRISDFKKLNLKLLLDDLYEYYGLIAKEKNITLNLDISSANAEITGDKNLLFQAFSNIMENAIKFTPEEGVITLKADCEGNAMKVSITDTGPGIPDSDKQQVFRRFYRVDGSRNTPGNGLGLALVKAVMDLHKIKISLLDNKPSGLCLTFVFSDINKH
mgnify:CR=1 FL=1